MHAAHLRPVDEINVDAIDTHETGAPRRDVLEITAPAAVETNIDDEAAASLHQLRLPSARTLRRPVDRDVVQPDGAMASPALVFRAVNAGHAAAIDVFGPRIAPELQAADREVRRLRRVLRATPRMHVLRIDADKTPWNVADRIQLALAAAALVLMITLGAAFILDHLMRIDPTLAYVGIGPTHVASALSIAGLSVISSLVVTHFVPERMHRAIVILAFVVGVPMFLAGLTELLGRTVEGADAPDYLAAFTGESAQSAAELPITLWLALRLSAEWMLVSVLKISMDRIVQSHRRTITEPNPEHARARKAFDEAQARHAILTRKNIEFEALKKEYQGQLAAFAARMATRAIHAA